MRAFPSSALVLALSLTLHCGIAAQGTQRAPKIVIVAKKPTVFAPTTMQSFEFGNTCHADGKAKSPYINTYKSVSIADVLAARVSEIRITRYGQDWKNRDDIRNFVLLVLAAHTNEVGPGIEWDEGVMTDLVGTIRFADGKKGAFEESGQHVCFNDHDGAVIFTRIQFGK